MGSRSKRVAKRKTSFEQTSMQRPQLLQSPDKTTGLEPGAPRSAGVMTWGSGQTAKQSMQSSQAARASALTRSRLLAPTRP